MQPWILQLPVGPMANFSYLIGAKDGREAVVIDPGWEAERILERANAEGRNVVAVLLTHGHFDHVQEVGAILRASPVPVFVDPRERYSLDPAIVTTPLADGQRLSLAGVEFLCIGTPGHSPGGITFHVGDALITGDTLFVGACGRADLPGSNPRQLYESLQRLAALDETLTVYSGHDYGATPTSTIGHEKKTNPYMHASSLDAFLGRRMG